jgi:hypothetical protein
MMSFLTNHDPNVIHIAVIVVLPLFIIHRKAWQWGAGTINGDIKNPHVVRGVHHVVYKCALT